MKHIKKTPIILGLISLMAIFAFAKQKKVLQIFRNGEVIQEYAVDDIDYIEVNDCISAPDDVNTSVSNNQITITWNAVENATYSVYRSSDNNNYTLLASELTETIYTDTNPLAGTNYYKIKAIVDGRESEFSSVTSAILPNEQLASGIYLGIYGFSKGFQTFPITHLSEDNISTYHSFVDGLSATESFTWLYYVVDKSINELQSAQLPNDLTEVAIVTFTDGLDIGSLDEKDKEEPGKYLKNAEYRDALHTRLMRETISNRSIAAYTIGIIEGKGASLSTFRNNMNSLATSSENVFEVSDIDNLNQIFQEVANSLSETKYVQKFVLSISGQSHNEKCRFTFDNVNSYSASNLYIEGIYNRQSKALTDVKYVGLTSTSGSVVNSTYNEVDGKYDFTFEGLQTPDGRLIPTDHVNHWFTDEGVWQDVDDEFFFAPDDATLQKIKRSAAIMLNLDCSKSMNGTKFTKLKEAASSFIQKLADNSIDPYEVSSVSLDKTNVTLPIGSTAKLIATVLPTTAKLKSVIWTSSDNSIASIDEDGTIHALAPGTATITATTEDGGFTANCQVTVVTLANEVSLNNSSLELFNGEVATLIATVLPENTDDKTVAWSSSNTAVAAVNNVGVVTAIAPGVATITAKTTDGSNKNATCTITVLQHVEQITIDNPTLTTFVGASNLITATVLPANASNKNVIWSSSDDTIITINENGFYHALASGTATITAKTVDGNYSASCSVTVVETPATSISLNTSSALMYRGETFALIATLSPDNVSVKNVQWESSHPDIASVNEEGLVTANKIGSVSISAVTTDGTNLSKSCSIKIQEHYTGLINGYEYIDLGLPSGLKWATMNIGATKKSDYGRYYAWGETSEKSSYTTSNSVTTVNKSILGIQGDSKYDAATKNWGATWRIPSRGDFNELIDNCTWTWAMIDGHSGYIVKGPNGNTIFLPGAGLKVESDFQSVGLGFYWTSSRYNDILAWRLNFSNSEYRTAENFKAAGISIRPVSD